MIAALNRDDRHHRWAVNVIAAQRKLRAPIVVPEVVAGEAYTKLRYDHRVSGRHDARPALTVFGLLDPDSELFEIRGMPSESHRRSVDLLARYVDQTFSWVDAIVLLSADDDRQVGRIWTVDSTLRAYRFLHQVVVSGPGG
ncbi:MAG: type II toxin-antitoxin system VapC family toxin [Candidatus Dormibacteraceae bacterium]